MPQDDGGAEREGIHILGSRGKNFASFDQRGARRLRFTRRIHVRNAHQSRVRSEKGNRQVITFYSATNTVTDTLALSPFWNAETTSNLEVFLEATQRHAATTRHAMLRHQNSLNG